MLFYFLSYIKISERKNKVDLLTKLLW
jgi:hypothetical protein